MDASELAQAALECYERVLASDPRLRVRPGQRLMAERVAQTFAHADLAQPGKAPEAAQVGPPQRAIAVIQAGTGVGKSLAYCAPGMALAQARNTRLLISTATVALQEQLVHKDLPALAAQFDPPLQFALAKGRGRYVCRLKLERRLQQLGVSLQLPCAASAPDPADARAASSEPMPEPLAEDDWFADAAFAGTSPSPDAERSTYGALQAMLSNGSWDGDFDTLAQADAAHLWPAVAVQASACAARHCPLYARCSYFEQRKRLTEAQVIVVNHDLLLSTLGTRTLPELEQSLLVIDEAHHLPATALEQFAKRMDLSRLGWIERLTQRALKVAATLGLSDSPELAVMVQNEVPLRRSLQALARQVLEHYGAQLRAQREQGVPAAARVPQGALPAPLQAPLEQLLSSASVYVEALRALAKALRAQMRDAPAQSHRLALQYAELGSLAPRLEAVYETAGLLLQADAEGAVPVAKWFTWEGERAPGGAGGAPLRRPPALAEEPALVAHASPTLPGPTLRQHLWGQVRAAVLTSATLSSCASFDFFLREAGLEQEPDACALEVPSPFDFARQGHLVLARTQADPRDASAYGPELVQLLLADLATVQRGALVLFTSRQQLRLATEALPPELRARVLVQNEWPRRQLLQRHAQRVAAGQPSIIFGLQSFGEGLDLPGRLCEDLFITKLPFNPPDDPVGQARAEWLRAAGRDAFSELVLPAAAIRLAQWVGRAIRTEDDCAHVVCYDRRLHQSGFGQHLLAGLPPFARSLRAAGAPYRPAAGAGSGYQALAGGKRRYQAP